MYIGSLDKNIYSLNVFNGQKKWSYLTDSQVKTTPIVINGVVYVGVWN
jgi:outer membrane protein assembly factor BamB